MFALILIGWAVVDASYLPERLFSLTHHLRQGSALARYDDWSSYYLVGTSFLVVRVLALLLVILEMRTLGEDVILGRARGSRRNFA